MSGHAKCTCTPKTGFRNPENMRVVHRNCNFSYFEYPKGAMHYSDYSSVVCIGQNGLCPMHYRTKQSVVDIRDLQRHEIHWMNQNTSQYQKVNNAKA